MSMLDPIPYAKAQLGERRWYLRDGSALYGPMFIDEINEMTERGLIGSTAIVFKASRFYGAKERLLQREIRFTVKQALDWTAMAIGIAIVVRLVSLSIHFFGAR